jgi:uncharacterized protein (TIGR00296 family)
MALSAALDDERFGPISRTEPVEIEVSVLSPMKRVRKPGQLIAGVHGGCLECGAQAGLLLPKVASERGWDSAQFLQVLTRKAGLPSNIYAEPAARLSVFRAQVFSDRTS